MKLLSKDENDTKEIGRKIGKKLKRGDVVCLYGELGSGKTTMVKGIASVFGIHERDITSASFTIIAEYQTEVPFYHIDLYRIASGDIAELGLQDYLGRDGVAVIECAERTESEIPEKSIKVYLSYCDNMRDIQLEGVHRSPIGYAMLMCTPLSWAGWRK